MTTLPPNMPLPSGVYSILHSEAVSSPAAPIPKSASLFSMRNKTAVITGAGRGMGLEIAVAYAEAGAVVYCVDLADEPSADWERCRVWIDSLLVPDHEPPGIPGQQDLEKGKAKADSSKSKGRLEYVQCDVTEHKATHALIDRIADTENGIHVCVVCAAVLLGGGFLDCDEENLDMHMKVNLNGAVFTTQAAARQMVTRRIKGTIILISSIGGSVAIKTNDVTAYSASKAALLQLSRSIACELGPKGIRCNSISPGVVHSHMTSDTFEDQPDVLATLCSQNPLGRIANLDEVRGAALFLGSDASSFCTGSNLTLDGGHTAW